MRTIAYALICLALCACEQQAPTLPGYPLSPAAARLATFRSTARSIAKCELDAMKLYVNDVREGNYNAYVRTCMIANGYVLTGAQSCLPDNEATDPQCYTRDTPSPISQTP
jgi:hypothetical protein